ncbi:DUF1684 domain-containing protein [Leucobacter sp. wl10]|uniref:DUF1684 domain-containing protein n=1 Tax=Leucobacter sp. wl10 TaxID=2304677 RepID=UPI001F096FEF|nr:DUF1684 domain-containing protein [Leucobacter sp. wl10]
MMDAERAADREAWNQWIEARRRAVAGPVGNLALVAFQPVGVDPVDLPGFPAQARREAEEAGVRVRPTGAGLELATVAADVWEPVDEERFVARLGVDGLPLLRAGGRTADVFSLDGSDYEIRLYDAASPALAAFAGISAYEYDPDWRVSARLEAYEEHARVPWEFTRSTDTGHTKVVPGVIRAEIAGRGYELTAFADGGQLVLVFADETSGRESYAPGRFLRFDPPAADFSGSGEVVLDFNRAFIPPCGFSDFYSCPIPPAQNRIAAPVRAGERRVLWNDRPAASAIP